MENRQNIIPEGGAEARPLAREEAAEYLARDIRMHLDGKDLRVALALFEPLHPVDQGGILAGLPGERCLELVAALAPNQTAQILDHLEPEEAAEVAAGIEARALSRILDETSPDVAADILKQLPQERSQEVLGGMGDAREVTPLLGYPDDSAGGLMTPDYPVVRESTTTANALDQLRLLGPDAENINAVFVVDDQQVLVCSLSITRLALARPAGPSPFGARATSGRAKQRLTGRGRRTGDLRLEGQFHVGPRPRVCHVGQYAGCGTRRRRRPSAAAASAHGLRGVVHCFRDYFHRCHRLPAVSRTGGRLR